MLIARKKYETLERKVNFYQELVHQYSRYMIVLADQNGKLDAELALARHEIEKLIQEINILKAEKEVAV